jgi:hypothetical protein
VDLSSVLGDAGAGLEFQDADSLHRALARWNRRRMATGTPGPDWRGELEEEARFLSLEVGFVEAFRRAIAPQAAKAPAEPDAFMAWFESLRDAGPGQWDPLFGWLETEATLPQMRWFLTQEAAGEAGFDDLVAMTQVKLPTRPKLELARNYWDEMGRGAEAGMHGPMLDRVVRGLALEPSIETTVWPSLALANTMTALASRRRYVYQSVGALGVVELTAPTRVAAVEAGLARLGVAAEQRKYFKLHAHLDIEHSRAWNAEAIRPLAEEGPEVARCIAEGALMRLVCGEACFEAYRAKLWAGADVMALRYAAE